MNTQSLARWATSLTIAFFSLSPTQSILAQTAAELVTVSALTGSLDPSVSLPTGSFAVSNPKYLQEFANQLGPEFNQYHDYQLYVAKGITARLADAFVIKLETNFVAAGYLKDSSSTQNINGELRTRSSYSDGTQAMLLYIVKRSDGVYFLVGKK